MTPDGRPPILIVDDQPRNLDALEAMLMPLECTLVRAGSADEALLSLLRHEFAAIVLDIRMPGMDGIELAKLIKQRRRSQHVPILFLTAHLVDERDALQGYGAGAVDYLSKPVNPEILRSKVGVLASSKALHKCFGSPKAKPSRTTRSPGRLGVWATMRPVAAPIPPAGSPSRK